MAEDLADPGDERSVAVAHDGDRLVGAAIVQWVTTDRISYLVLEDLAVEPALRSAGIGAGLVGFIEAAGRDRGMAWAFLESGLGNEGAHSFFERHGFAPMSKVFSKRLT
jgi:GNAT superfamily N-acetyltransferase